ncbi:cupin domain-containing protein [Shinella sp. 838]|jgi:transcriptional regulator with XRE-family HTH domain|uniref:helix-turn-helix domain-containing protein n=1 Tax=unclassified Shinella TaxID=2643062 RepID=UPI0003C5551A|nr:MULTISPECIES: cupin domain-containing protein [unclassified Shinella]EYR79311.1 transcriptional regulator XRE family [Shinella sp. DD12]MDG4672490.1 cupin domain-containing protein [Shinella sp. 838]
MNDIAVATRNQAAVGEKVKAFRTARRMSLRTLGEATGTTASFLSQLERGLSGVNISTLMRIAGALGISLTDLFEEAAPPVGRVLRKHERPALPPAEGYRKMLLSRRPIRDMEVYIGEFDPGGSTGDKPYSHGDSHELFFVLKGEVELTLGEERHVLSAGDSIEYPTSVPHKTVNIGKEPAEVLWMIAPPTSVADDLDKYLPRPGS